MKRSRETPTRSGRLIVSLSDQVMDHVVQWVTEQDHEPPYLTDLRALAERLGMEDADLAADLLAFLSEIDPTGEVETLRCIRPEVATASAILALETQASTNRVASSPPSLLSFWVVDVPSAERYEAVRYRVSAGGCPSVRGVTPEYGVGPVSPVNEPSNVLSYMQEYLNPGPVGIDAKAAWKQELDGKDVQLGMIDIEYDLGHPDLPGDRASEIPGFERPLLACADHGTKALGVVVAKDNGSDGAASGVVGIAPEVSKIWLSSLPFAKSLEQNVAEGIVAMTAPGRLEQGDVILIEVGTYDTAAGCYRPVEFTPLIHVAISDAIYGAGLVVVQPAGNGGKNLDKIAPAGYVPTDSILVGSCLKQVEPIEANEGPHLKGHRPRAEGLQGDSGAAIGQSEATNYGSMVDCFAWGEAVVTTIACTGPGDDYGYTDGPDNFGGTSAASAIIAGAAILLQQREREAGTGPLTSGEMKDLLSKKATGTHSKKVHDAEGTLINIGVMPDLAAILAGTSSVPVTEGPAGTEVAMPPDPCQAVYEDALARCAENWWIFRPICRAVAWLRYWWCREVTNG